MTDSWTEPGATAKKFEQEVFGDEKPTLNPPAQMPTEIPPHRITFHPEPHVEEVRRDIERREKARDEELKHLDELYDRVEHGIDHGVISLESGSEMLLNIIKARSALRGIGVYPGAW